MGASISYDTSYILTMNADVECFTLYPAKSKSKSGGSKSQKGDKSSGKRRKGICRVSSRLSVPSANVRLPPMGRNPGGSVKVTWVSLESKPLTLEI